MAENHPKRVAIYTHDTFGLGHVRRCLHIARALAKKEPDVAILMITGSPALHAFKNMPANMDVIKIPTVVKTGCKESHPSHLPLSVKEVTKFRSHLVKHALGAFQPDVFLVDNFPLGSRKELLPALELLESMPCRTILGLRDILDKPEVVQANWREKNIYSILDQYYDHIIVYGHPEILNIKKAYALPENISEKMHYCGYVTDPVPPSAISEQKLKEMGLIRPFVLVTVGGGGDGLPIIKAFLEAMPDIPSISALVVTGPLMGRSDRAEVEKLAERSQRVILQDFLVDLPRYIAAADIVVTMGGYNTISEILLLRKKVIVIPRNWCYGEHASKENSVMEYEQLIRAQALERMGLADLIQPEQLEPSLLANKIENLLSQPQTTCEVPFEMLGAENAASLIASNIYLENEQCRNLNNQ